MSGELYGEMLRKSSADAEIESDSCGSWERGHVSMLQVKSRQGIKWFPYGGLEGIDQRGEEEACLNFVATLMMADAAGELRTERRLHRVVIKGERLKRLLRNIGVSRQTAVWKSESRPEPPASYVTSIDIEVVEE